MWKLPGQRFLRLHIKEKKMEKAFSGSQQDAMVLRNGLYSEQAHADSIYHVKCIMPDGGIRWEDDIHNVVTTVGKNLALDTYLAGSGYTAVGPFMGLISSVGYSTNVSTISSGTYTSGTGAVSLTTSGAHNLLPGDTFTISSITGSGTNFGLLNSTFTATSGTASTTINFVIIPGLTITTITGGTVTGLGTKESDTMASHSGWFEVDASTHTPAVAARLTTNTHWSAAASGSKSLSAALAFTIITNPGTLKGCFLVYGSGAVATLGDTNGTLYSAGLFSGGDKTVSVSDVVQVSFTASI